MSSSSFRSRSVGLCRATLRPRSGLSLAAALILGTLAGCGTPPRPTDSAPPPLEIPPSVQTPPPLASDAEVRTTPRGRWVKAEWRDLPGWDQDTLTLAWPALTKSCDKALTAANGGNTSGRGLAAAAVATGTVGLSPFAVASAWNATCREVRRMGPTPTEAQVRAELISDLREIVDEVGVDAARYSLIRYPVDSPLTLDLDAITRQSSDNPVFYVQYAHARIASVLRNADELGVHWREADLDPALLQHEREVELLGVIREFPRIVATAAELREPHRVARYLEELATAYHRFYDACRVLPRGDEAVTPTHIARLWLCAAARQTLANGLGLLGVGAPERM